MFDLKLADANGRIHKLIINEQTMIALTINAPNILQSFPQFTLFDNNSISHLILHYKIFVDLHYCKTLSYFMQYIK